MKILISVALQLTLRDVILQNHMPDETTPEFTSKLIPVEPNADEPVKAAKKRKKRAPAKRVGKILEPQSSKAINETLASIYKNDVGDVNDMGQIEIKKPNSFMKFFSIFLVLSAIIAAVVWAAMFTGGGRNGKFSEAQIGLSINGPTTVPIGATSTYTITYQNDEDQPITNLTLNVHYPAGFIFSDSSKPASNAGHTEWALGTLGAHESGTLTISGVGYAAEGQELSWRVFLNYRPQNFNSPLQKNATLTTSGGQYPVSISISGPDKIVVGKDTSYTFAIINPKRINLPQLELVPIFPYSFALSTSTPSFGKNNRWVILPPTTTVTTSFPSPAGQLTFTVIGKFTDAASSSTPIGADLLLTLPGQKEQVTVSHAELATALSKSDLDFNVAVNGSLAALDSRPGDLLVITVHAKNTGKQDLKNASVSLTFDAPSLNRQSVIDWANIVDKYDGDLVGEQLDQNIRRGQLSWTAKKIPELALLKQGAEVNIEVRLPIKKADSPIWNSKAEPVILAASTLTYFDKTGAAQTIPGNPITISLNSDLSFTNKIDKTQTADGKKQFNISWVINNTLHPLKNIELSANLFGDVSWNPGSAQPSAGKVSYEAAQKKVTWSIPEMPNSVDILAAPFSVTLNTDNPSQSILVSKVHITALDTVTNKTLDFVGDETPLK